LTKTKLKINSMETFLRILLASLLAISASAKEIKLLNVSYDPTREFYTEYNAAFAKYWKVKTGDDVTVSQSHGGSGKQTGAVRHRRTRSRRGDACVVLRY
jgi:ABC-type sulfate transport system substrate-binding protein